MPLDAGQIPFWLSNSNTGLFLRRASAKLGVALQPIVDINTGETVAFEALVRGHATLGFGSIEEMFTHAAASRILIELEACVIQKALAAFAHLRRQFWSLLFLNLDGRTLSARAQISAKLAGMTRTLNLEPSDLCIELSERNRVLDTGRLAQEVEELRKSGYSVALDDFGVGDSGLQALYESNPSFLKIDRFFISSIQSDRKKKLMVSAIVDLAHSMGVRVIAEGVETVEELHACREIRCDLAQGYLVDHPQTDLARLRKFYTVITENRERRKKRISTETIRACVEPLPSLTMQASLADVFEFFKQHPEQNIIPVVDGGGVPQGVVNEKDLKPFVYSPYGRDLLRNSSLGIGLKDFLRSIPVTDINSQLAPLLDLVTDELQDGVLITEGIRYKGVLLAGALVRLANEMRLAAASDRNPLTGLPGNVAIKTFLDKAAADASQKRIACYIDIDNFKPFNDTYGFRTGDRALMMLSEHLKLLQIGRDIFVGHIGGDDFFVGASGLSTEELLPRVAELQEAFAREVKALYSADDRMIGYICGRDREGNERRFDLLGCTVAAVVIPAGVEIHDTEQLANALASAKSRAKGTKGALLEHALVSSQVPDCEQGNAA